MAEYNARVEERRAEQTKRVADLEEARQRNRVAKVLASQRAAIAASGLDLEGSPLLVMEETAAEGELDALLIRHSGSVQEAQALSQAAADRMAGRAAKARGATRAVSTLLTGVGTLARHYGPSSANTYGGDE